MPNWRASAGDATPQAAGLLSTSGWPGRHRPPESNRLFSKACPTPVAGFMAAVGTFIGPHGVNGSLSGQPHASRD
jgi:hypothetical protein